MKIVTVLLLSIIFTSISSTYLVAQQTAMGTSIQVELSDRQNNIAPPDLLPGLFFQFPFGKKIAINTSISFGKKRHYYQTSILSGTFQPQISTTQYHERTISFEQMMKIYFGKNPDKHIPKVYGTFGYSIRKPRSQNGITKTPVTERSFRFDNKDLPRQKKINLGFGIDYFLDHKFFLSLESGVQTPLWNEENSDVPILVGSNIFYFNLKVGIHINQLIYISRNPPERINIKDLQIKN